MALNFRIIAKLGFLLVILGFLMPVACDMNGFQLAETFMNMDGTGSAILLYGLFIAALAGLVVGALLMIKKDVPVAVDWVILLACIGCGLGVFFGSLNNNVTLQSGAYVIVVGWIVALTAQILSMVWERPPPYPLCKD